VHDVAAETFRRVGHSGDRDPLAGQEPRKNVTMAPNVGKFINAPSGMVMLMLRAN